MRYLHQNRRETASTSDVSGALKAMLSDHPSPSIAEQTPGSQDSGVVVCTPIGDWQCGTALAKRGHADSRFERKGRCASFLRTVRVDRGDDACLEDAVGSVEGQPVGERWGRWDVDGGLWCPGDPREQ